MGMTIGNLPVPETLANEDKLHGFQYSSGTDIGVPLSLLKAYVAANTNGIFKGSVTESEKSLDSFSASDTGVWKWTCTQAQVRSDFPYTYGIVEIIRHEERAGTDPNYDYIQRISVGDAIYQRMKTATNSGAWSAFKRFDVDYEIKYGSSTYNGTAGQTVNFTTPFLASATPRVFIMPINLSPDHSFYAQLWSTDANGFTFTINHQHLPGSSGCPIIGIDFDNKVATNLSELSQYISDYCLIDNSTSCGFHWLAIAPKVVTGS